MPEDLNGLIEKINQEGVIAAKDKARVIEEEAKRRADDIIGEAKKEALRILAEAESKIARMEEGGKASLKQAGRDMLISLKKEVNAMLEKLIISSVSSALKPDDITKILTTLIEEYSRKGESGITVLLKKEDLEKIEKALFSRLKAETRKGVTLKPSDDVRGGFIISYDSGKSHYDFTDKALAEYIGLYLKPKLGDILK